MDHRRRSTYPIVTGDFSKARFSHLPKVPVHECFALADPLEILYNQHKNFHETYDDEGQEIPGMARIMPDDVDFTTPAGLAVLSTISRIQKIPFSVEEDPDRYSNTVRCLNTPFISMLNSHVQSLEKSNKILILCAGDGEDLCRIQAKQLVNATNIDLVGATTLNKRARIIYSAIKDKVQIRMTPEYLHDLPPDFLLKYDIILCHQGLHHIVPHSRGERAFVNLIGNHLVESGIFIGDYFDKNGAQEYERIPGPTNHSIVLKDVYAPTQEYLEGLMKVRVVNTEWDDAVLTSKRLESILKQVGCEPVIHRGKGVFTAVNVRGVAVQVPSHLRDVAKMQECMVMSTVEIVHRRPILDIEIGHVSNWRRVPLSPPIQGLLTFPLNRGHPICPVDIKYISDSACIYLEKSNGVAAHVCVTSGGAYMLDALGNCYHAQYRAAGMKNLFIQAEKVGDDVYINELIYEGDVGSSTSSTFMYRTHKMNRILDAYPALRSILKEKKCYDSWKEAYDEYQRCNWEGVVVMQTTAPSPMKGNNFVTTARYAKRVITRDVKRDGKVVEEELVSGEWVYSRDRPDKKNGNNTLQMEKIRDAIPASEINSIISARNSKHPPGIEEFMNDAYDILTSTFDGEFDCSNEYFLTVDANVRLIVGGKSYNNVRCALNENGLLEVAESHSRLPNARSLLLATTGRKLVCPGYEEYYGALTRIRDRVAFPPRPGEYCIDDDVDLSLSSGPWRVGNVMYSSRGDALDSGVDPGHLIPDCSYFRDRLVRTGNMRLYSSRSCGGYIALLDSLRDGFLAHPSMSDYISYNRDSFLHVISHPRSYYGVGTPADHASIRLKKRISLIVSTMSEPTDHTSYDENEIELGDYEMVF